MLFYPSKVYSGTKEKPYQPERITGRVMVNPKYKVSHIEACDVICDSGAFQDIDKSVRLTPEQALARQLKYRNHLAVLLDNPSFTFEALCIYDQMAGVDECIDECTGKKVKKRGTVESAKVAVDETLHAAQYYTSNYQDRLMLIAQGINPEQYTDCTHELLTLRRRDDYYGMGGFCIIGKQRKRMLPIFYATVDAVFPVIKSAQMKRVHLLGVCIPDAVEYAAKQAAYYGLELSTDSSAPEVGAYAFGKVYLPNGRQTYPKWRKYIDYDPRELAYKNVQTYHEYSLKLGT